MQAILVFALLGPSFLQQQLPDATVFLKQQAVAAEKYRTVQYVAESSLEILSGPLAQRKTPSEVAMYVKNPGNWRVELKAQGQPALTIVSDGEFIWIYNPLTKQYTKTAAAMGMTGVVSSTTSLDMFSVLAGRQNEPENASRRQSPDRWAATALLGC
jgi:outer membrane lipoprotein-sorting protein